MTSPIYEKCIYYFDQSIGVSPFLTKNSLVLENGLLPKKPEYAENGEGWGLIII